MECGCSNGNVVRVGVVSAVDIAGKRVRVIYKDKGITSGWLHVLQHSGASVSVVEDGEHTHAISDTYTGGGVASADGKHEHLAAVTYWMPAVNDMVLVLYLPIFNGDGFVLGAI